MQERESPEFALKRWEDLHRLQAFYPEFEDFLEDIMTSFMGFDCSDVQKDIADFLQHGPLYRMIQAQRGQAKTTITACYAVWRIIHNPATRVLIISSGEGMATEIANWVIQIIRGMDILACLRPDRAAGDRESVSAYDIHHSLKGPEKSPSVACLGITSNLQGKRADVLIADDIESAKNSQTAVQRARLHHLTLDFTSICSTGDIIWLGTPQSVDSIYNTLPGRGTIIRVWPGRYPTIAEMPDYDGFLAPTILQHIMDNPMLQIGGGMDGTRGQVTDPILLGEEVLVKKEIDQGAAYFQLQHMLSTKLSDNDRYPLKLGGIRFMGFNREEHSAPASYSFVRQLENKLALPEGFPLQETLYTVKDVRDECKFDHVHMFIDPSGGGKNGDETGYAVVGYLSGRVYALACGGVKGGVDEDSLDEIVDLAVRWNIKSLDIEENYGNGMYRNVLSPKLLKKHRCGIEGVWSQGQKELRIIETLEPLIGSGKFIMHTDMVAEDWAACQKYPVEKRSSYSMIFQMARITRDRDSLLHDDRLEALAAACGKFVEEVNIDEQRRSLDLERERYEKMVTDPFGHGHHHTLQGADLRSQLSALSKHGLQTVSHLSNTRSYYNGHNQGTNR